MNLMSAEQDRLVMLLTQMGAKVKTVHGLICYVRFNINDIEFFYIYTLHANNQYCLQMIKPYRVGAGLFAKPNEILSYIKKDIKRFKNALNSTNFEKFITINTRLYNSIHFIEDSFLDYNIPPETLLEVEKKLDEIETIITNVRDSSTKIEVK